MTELTLTNGWCTYRSSTDLIARADASLVQLTTASDVQCNS
jgi:hypothetical protein